MVDPDTPVASAKGGGFITASGQIVRGSPNIQARVGTRFGEGGARGRRKRAEAEREAQIKEAELQAELERQRQAQAQLARERRLTQKERRSLLARNKLRIEAQARGRPFTRLETQRFLRKEGGSPQALRSASQKGFRVSASGSVVRQSPLRQTTFPQRDVVLGRLGLETPAQSFQRIGFEEVKPIFVKSVIGEAGITSKGRSVPQTAFFRIDPLTGETRRATLEEQEQLSSQPKELVASSTPRNLFSSVKNQTQDLFGKSNVAVTKSITLPALKGIGSINKRVNQIVKRDVLPTSIESARRKATNLPSAGQFLAGAGISQVGQLRNRPVQVLAEVGLSAGVGAGVGATSKLLRLSTLGRGAGKPLLIGAEIGASAFFTGKELRKITSQSTAVSKGEVFGRALPSIAGFTLGARAGSRTVGFFGEKITIRGPIRSIKPPQVLEVQQNVLKDTGLFSRSTFKIVSERKPPTFALTTTRFRLLARGQPLGLKVFPARRGPQVQTIGVIEKRLGQSIQPPFAVIKSASKRGISTISQVSGTTKSISKSQLSQLRSVPKQLAKDLVKARTGRQPSSKELEKILSKQGEFSVQDILAKQSIRFNQRTGTLEAIPLGKRISRSVAVTQTKPIGETEKVALSSFRTQFKDVTFPFARAGRKPISLEGTLISIKDLKIETTGFQRGFKIEGGKKTSLSKTFQEVQKQIAKQSPSPSAIPSVIPSTAKTPSATLTQARTTSSPLFKDSQFQGKGLFEQTQDVSRSVNRLSSSNMGVVLANALSSQPKSIIKTETKTQLKNTLRQQPKLLIKQQPRQIIKQQPKLSTRLAQRQQPKQLLKLLIKPSTKLPPAPPIVGGLRKGSRQVLLGRGGRKKKEKKSGQPLTVEVRRRGKFRQVATTRDINKALRIGTGITSSTLGATFRIRGAKSIGTPAGFRRPKIPSPSNTFIEKKQFRLSKAGEIKEIQRARRKR